MEAYSCIPTFYNYEKEGHKHDYTRSYVYRVVYQLCSKARSATTATTRSSGATASSAIKVRMIITIINIDYTD